MIKTRILQMAFAAILVSMATPIAALELDGVKARGELRHLGIRYANFVTGAEDGFDVELMQGFARHLGVSYKLVYTEFNTVMRDLLGKDVSQKGQNVTLTGNYPIKGDIISTGFTMLPWREKLLLFSDPVFPSQVVLIAPSHSKLTPIKGSGDTARDIEDTKRMIGKSSLLVMKGTCLDPAPYGFSTRAYSIKPYVRSRNLNEMVPALINGEADLTLLDMPDVILDMRKWAGAIKVIGPISPPQTLATAFPKDAPRLRDAFNLYLRDIKADGTYDRLVDKYYPGIWRQFPDFFERSR
jgi:ABC-type amino acid transport substrate-binding protein